VVVLWLFCYCFVLFAPCGQVRSSTEELLKAIEGLVVMGSALEIASVSLQYQKVPQMWEAAAYPSLKPLGSWLTDLEGRITFIDEVRKKYRRRTCNQRIQRINVYKYRITLKVEAVAVVEVRRKTNSLLH
jgi:mRNA-degrading endonuclease RelE of RelBE toxin-antitoxin system